MSIKAIFFDLDGTLLPMDQEKYVNSYLGRLAKKLAPYGFEPDILIDAMWKGTGDMIGNDGTRPNEEVFWERFCSLCGENSRDYQPVLDEFYRNEFQNVKEACGFEPRSAEIISLVKKLG